MEKKFYEQINYKLFESIIFFEEIEKLPNIDFCWKKYLCKKITLNEEIIRYQMSKYCNSIINEKENKIILDFENFYDNWDKSTIDFKIAKSILRHCQGYYSFDKMNIEYVDICMEYIINSTNKDFLKYFVWCFELYQELLEKQNISKFNLDLFYSVPTISNTFKDYIDNNIKKWKLSCDEIIANENCLIGLSSEMINSLCLNLPNQKNANIWFDRIVEWAIYETNLELNSILKTSQGIKNIKNDKIKLDNEISELLKQENGKKKIRNKLFRSNMKSIKNTLQLDSLNGNNLILLARCGIISVDNQNVIREWLKKEKENNNSYEKIISDMESKDEEKQRIKKDILKSITQRNTYKQMNIYKVQRYVNDPQKELKKLEDKRKNFQKDCKNAKIEINQKIEFLQKSQKNSIIENQINNLNKMKVIIKENSVLKMEKIDKKMKLINDFNKKNNIGNK
ncbi:hypothetical protein M0812_02983 [Anaeramoeba flamelloides]|uniref:Uncharacterized protein n=1 Tax=Anaeramoeba flamelloides TaxID=1746091 RepID=A0AAV7YTS0_9EUKA|nr:hypothetical protein M0812_02983 [Anaeramoeba flamelloides]